MAGTLTLRYRPSAYNFSIASSEGAVALYNARTGALIHLRGEDSSSLATFLLSPSNKVAPEAFGRDVLRNLTSGGFLIKEDFDELCAIRETYWRARGETPAVLTITTTMECNLGCYYCYEARTAEAIQPEHIDSIVASTRKTLESQRNPSLHVDWYGGEPLLNVEFLETASFALQKVCHEIGASYVASVISNGTEWPDDVESFIQRHRIRQVQISFDGLEENHNKRRRYRKLYHKPGASSFGRAVGLVDRLVRVVRVDVRMNLDQRNSDDLVPFIRFAREREWFEGPYPAVFQPARISAYSARSGFVRSSELSLEKFDQLRAVARFECSQRIEVEESEVPDGYPFPKTSVCAALASNSQVVGADGLAYRCGLQVGEKNRAVGVVFEPHKTKVPSSFPDADWWKQFDPTRLQSCSRCSFLPICWGGCPKKHLESDSFAIQEQGRYWRTNLPRLLALRAGFESTAGAEVSEALQFR